MPLCEFGCNCEATHQFPSSGKWCCSSNVNACPGKRARDSEKKQGIAPNFKNGHPRGMFGKEPFNKGKTLSDLFGEEQARNIKNQMSVSISAAQTGRIQTSETREKLSEVASQRHANGWDNKAGRCKKYIHESPIAGTVSLDGTWELKVAQWLDANNYNWRRNTERFPYINPEGKPATYTPDFWVQEMNGFLEVKGYETELDRCKWQQFPEKLTVWKKDQIDKLS